MEIVETSTAANRTSMGGVAKQLYQDSIRNIDSETEVILTDPKRELKGYLKRQSRKLDSQRKWKHIKPRAFRYFDEGYFFTSNIGSSEGIKKLIEEERVNYEIRKTSRKNGSRIQNV